MDEKIIYKSYSIGKDAEIDDNANTIGGYITTQSPDRVRDEVISDGIDTSSYMKNPVVLFNHDYNLIVGKCVELRTERGRIYAKTFFAPTAFAQEKKDLAKNGFLNTFSIGFKSINFTIKDDGGWIFNKSELLEYSLVAVPMNAEAVITQRNVGNDQIGKLLLEYKESNTLILNELKMLKYYALKGMAESAIKKEIANILKK